MGQKRLKVILKKVGKVDDKGYLRVSIRENNKTSLKNIPLPPIELKFWNPDKQVVKSTFPKYREYNKKIEETLEELKSNKMESVEIPASKIMFLENCKLIVEKNYQKQSTKMRFNFYIQSFQNFIKENLKENDITISSLTTKFFEDYVQYETKNKRVGQNNIKSSISVIKTILRKIEKNSDIILPNNFYDKIISLKTVPKKKKILPIDNFQKILETRIENDQLEDSRQIFLFQVFSNGLRFSDVSTLRYKDFVIETFKGIPEIRFLKYQRKTRKLINTLVNFRSCKILARFIPRDSINMNDSQKLDYILQSDLVQNRTTSKLLETDSIKETLTVKLDNEIISRHFFTNPITVSAQELIPMRENYSKVLREKYQKDGMDDVSIEVSISQNEDLNYFNNLVEVLRKKVREQVENNIKNEENLNLEFYKIIAKILSDCKLKKPLDFVFPLLKNEDFSNILADDGFSLVSYKQQLLLNHSTISFNKNLKEICHILEIPTITSHFARNSFGSLLVALRGEKAIDPFSLMYAMGHSSIQQTQEYIQNLTNEGKDDLTKSLADNF